MKFIADLHIHSKYSLATAKNLDLENLYIAAQLKGITVLGTGDATHPGWMSEICEKLEPAQDGLFKLKDEISKECDKHVPLSCRSKVRFILVSEISNIYKKDNRTRKNHNLVFLPSLAAAKRFNSRLEKKGNIKSDGRPILGIDTRDLLETLLECSDRAFLIPAHIWTPWFSMLGSKSGFDSVEECFEDLSSHIFAVETGLSSDPPMNWRVKNLDNLTIVSNSDAHSPMKIGREANLFDTDISYSAIRSALETGDPERFWGTFEFYPQEGKYHLDGHRKCGVCFTPDETIAAKGICPVCKKPLTLGVRYRVEQLADRPDGEKPALHHPFHSIIPLEEILSEILQVGPNTKKVSQYYQSALAALGSEFLILSDLKIDEISRANIPLLDEAVLRMREKKVHPVPGYDGEFGKINIFSIQEREALVRQKTLFSLPPSDTKIKQQNTDDKNILLTDVKPRQKIHRNEKVVSKSGSEENLQDKILNGLNLEQKNAVIHADDPLLIMAGPGTGKTRTLTHRIAYLIRHKKVKPENILAVTFTIKAAQEMEERLKGLIRGNSLLPHCKTFHSFSFNLLNEQNKTENLIVIDDDDRKYLVKKAIKEVSKKGINISISSNLLTDKIAYAKQNILSPDDIDDDFFYDKSKTDQIKAVYRSYQQFLSVQSLFDYEDLIFSVVNILETDKKAREKYQQRYTHIFVDEYQDINSGQYRIIRALSFNGKNLCVIGDPSQSIYGFRGSDVKFFHNFEKDYPNSLVIRLTKNYRSTQTILDASFQVLAKDKKDFGNARIYSEIHGVKTIGIIETASEKAEAVAIGKYIEKMVGGTGFHSIDFDKVDANCEASDYGFSDFAVLFRTHQQIEIVSAVLEDVGIPCSVASRKKIYGKDALSGLLSFLKIIEKIGTYADLERVVKSFDTGISKNTLDKLLSWGFNNNFSVNEAIFNTRRFPIKDMIRKQQLSIDSFAKEISEMEKVMQKMTIENKLKYIVHHTGIEYNDAVKSLFDESKRYSYNFNQFITEITLKADTDIYDPKVQKVSLMTMHAAKGLEFPVVFIAGCENGLVPYKRSDAEQPDINEERRLFYVAMTRAKEQLYLTYAKKRRIFGRPANQNISPFVMDIEENIRAHEKHKKALKKKDRHVQMELFG